MKLLNIPEIKYDCYEDIERPCKKMCKTCAYKYPARSEESEAERDFFVERGNRPHACHEDGEFYCRGNFEFTKRLGLHDEMAK
ncbi:hypothetical protein FQ085_11700 [Planococcus sp. ANT_H30]|uniref:hypothetical protein n=1 Tax=Planococcus sp. ANT_H30 TaxID=2597347 RepID=UPI0011EC986A|nr:hypothetical protein [Planococcus sp. ANT_H30]KAA0956651.1 hypothetical protein FQ085_11700 [Planococcus sp. ANT_H30]